MSNLITFPASFILVQMFRRSKSRQPRVETFKNMIKLSHLDEDKVIKRSKKNFKLPWWFKIIAYCLALVLSGVSMFFIIVKGIQFGDEKVGKWLTSFVTSIFSSFLLTQPLQVSLLTFLIVCIFKKSNDEDELFEFEKYKNKENNFRSDSKSLEDDFQYNDVENTDNDLKYLRENLKRDKKAKDAIREIIFYFIFVFISFIVCYSKIDSNAFNYKTMIQNLFELNDQSSFDKVKLLFFTFFLKFGEKKTMQNYFS